MSSFERIIEQRGDRDIARYHAFKEMFSSEVRTENLKLFDFRQLEETITTISEPVVRMLNSSSSKPIGKIYNVLGAVRKAIQTDENTEISEKNLLLEQIDEMGQKTYELYVESINIGKSVSRGWKDLLDGNSLKTKMKNRIIDELIVPLSKFIQVNDVTLEVVIPNIANQSSDVERNSSDDLISLLDKLVSNLQAKGR